MSAFTHLDTKHVEVFKRACRVHNVAILVRQTNVSSLKHIGKAYATPKRIDCKAKTADNAFKLRPEHLDGAKEPGAALKGRMTRASEAATPMKPTAGQEREIAGLVVDPNIVGKEAYRGGKWASVQKAWADFSVLLAPYMATLAAQNTRFKESKWLHGFHYFVERDPWDPYFGCVKYANGGLINAQKVIHGDFDLYAIIDMTNPSANIRVEEKLAGQPHSRSPKFKDVQNLINGPMGLGIPMVLHGSQDTYASEHSDEGLDCFFPDGRAFSVKNKKEIEQLYQNTFGGRLLFSGKGAGNSEFGLWKSA